MKMLLNMVLNIDETSFQGLQKWKPCALDGLALALFTGSVEKYLDDARDELDVLETSKALSLIGYSVNEMVGHHTELSALASK